MKSKKKLIYKLHENINQNPFKQFDLVSFRNAGVKSYDFNKLKSIRSISLKGVESDPVQSGSGSADWKKKYDLKMNMVSIKDQIQQKAQQALICNKKKITVDKTLINSESKKINIRNLTKQKNIQTQNNNKQMRGSYIGKSSQESKDSNIQQQNLALNQSIIKQQQACVYAPQLSPRPKHAKSHSRNVSLPAISNRPEQPQNSTNSIDSRRQLDLLVEEQKAKQQVLKQIRLNAQQKINKQVLMSIKLKSIQNLQRIARSQSEVIKIDKWKEKYGQLGGIKNSQQVKPKDKAPAHSKTYLPEIQQHKKTKNSQFFSTSNPKPKLSQRYFIHSQEKLVSLQKNDIQIVKDSYEKLSDQKVQLHQAEEASFFQRQYQNLEGNNKMNQRSQELQHYYSTELLTKEQQDKLQFWHSQPLKINVTQLKKIDKKNKHNQNLSNSINKTTKIKENSSISKIQQKQGNEQSEDKKITRSKNFYNNTVSQMNQFQEEQQSLLLRKQSPFKTRSKLYLNLNKDQVKSQQRSEMGPASINIQKPSKNKCKINEQGSILDKIVDDGIPMEWQNRRYAQDQVADFDQFVQNQTKQQTDLITNL